MAARDPGDQAHAGNVPRLLLFVRLAPPTRRCTSNAAIRGEQHAGWHRRRPGPAGGAMQRAQYDEEAEQPPTPGQVRGQPLADASSNSTSRRCRVVRRQHARRRGARQCGDRRRRTRARPRAAAICRDQVELVEQNEHQHAVTARSARGAGTPPGRRAPCRSAQRCAPPRRAAATSDRPERKHSKAQEPARRRRHARRRGAWPRRRQLCATHRRRGAHGVRRAGARRLYGICLRAGALVAAHAFVTRVGARYGKALAALLVFLRRGFSMPLAVLVILALLHEFDLVPPEFTRLTTSLVIGVAIAALARAAATSVLAPDDPGRRLVSFDDATTRWLFAHLTWGGRLFGAFIALRAFHRAVGAPQEIDNATQMLFAVVIAALLIHLLTGRREADEEEGAAHSRHAPARLDHRRCHRDLAACRLRRLCGLHCGPRGLHHHAGRDALSSARRDRCGDRPDALGGLRQRPQARAPARHRAAPARPDRQADLRHRPRAVRADRPGARGRPLGSRGGGSVRGGQGRRARHPHRRLHDLVRRGVRRHRAVSDRRRADASDAALARE